MLVCGVSGRPGRGAAALVADGVLVAAVAEHAPPGPGEAGGRLPRAAIEACLRAAGATWRDVRHAVVAVGKETEPADGRASEAPAGASRSSATWHRRSRVAAHAAIAHAALGAVPVVATDGSRAAIAYPAGSLEPAPHLSGLLRRLPALARTLRATTDAASAVPALELLASSVERADRRDWFGGWSARANPDDVADNRAFYHVLDAAEAAAGGRLDDVESPHVILQRVRAELAESMLAAVARATADALAGAGPASALAGSAWRSPDFVDRVRQIAGRAVAVAPWAMPDAAAVGAALSVAGPGAALDDRALGPPATEPEAKAVLENCRLDYVYEPRWPRLMERVSKMLERGRLVAWFQGRAEFGDSLAGSRSILCDPSSRYARDNVNQFLRGVPLATPVPVSIAPGSAACVDGPALSPWAFARTRVGAEWLQALRAGVDTHGRAHVHVAAAASPFGDLLDLHRQRTGVPGLVNLPLAAMHDHPALTARDAVRAAFSSSVDVLVLHRFVVVKDYWQMRTDV